MSKERVFDMREKGFSLIELMVGLVIGLMATLVIMQVFSAFEGQKRATTGTADAQTNGTIALMQLQRHLQKAGYGMPMPMADLSNNILKCTSADGANTFPVMITDDATNAGDVITSRYSTTAAGAVPIEIIDVDYLGVPNDFRVDNNIGCGSDLEMLEVTYNDTYQDLTDTPAEKASQAENVAMLLKNDNQCESVIIVKQPTNIGGSSVITIENPSTIGIGPKDKLSCMGGYGNYALDVNVATNELRLNGDPIVSEVVSMQAQYGISNSAELNTVTAWVDATGAWAVPTLANRNRIKAVRIAMAFRNGLKEKDTVTGDSDLTWTGTDGTAVTLSVAHLPDWGNYRYRVFGTTVPLRNMIWSREAVE